MARPAGRAKQYSRATDTAGSLAVDRAGIVTGTTRCSPSRPVSCSVAGQAFALSAIATCDDATKLTLSVPHSSCAGPGRSGPEVYTSHRPELAPDETTRSGGGVVTVTVLVSGCGPVSFTTRLVRPPAGTGTCIVPPPADQRPVCPLACSDTASWLCASTRWPVVPAGDVTRIVTVSETGEKSHPRCSGTSAATGRLRQPATSVTSSTSASTVTTTVTRRPLFRDSTAPSLCQVRKIRRMWTLLSRRVAESSAGGRLVAAHSAQVRL